MKLNLFWSLSLLLTVRAAVIPRIEADSSRGLEARGGQYESVTDGAEWHLRRRQDDEAEDENREVNGNLTEEPVEDVEEGYQIGEGW
ncbi:hypothetical protein BJX64DRAFT_287497 [Aspergillus heterothallicus]